VRAKLPSGVGVPLGIVEVLVTVGVLGLFGYCYVTCLDTFPVLLVSDPLLTTVTEH